VSGIALNAHGFFPVINGLSHGGVCVKCGIRKNSQMSGSYKVRRRESDKSIECERSMQNILHFIHFIYFRHSFKYGF